MILIDRNAVLNRFQDICYGTACMDCPFFNKDGCAVEKLILDSAAVDAKPVRHGHWDVIYNNNIPYAYRCSLCGRTGLDNGNYCPHCGALMDEVKK